MRDYDPSDAVRTTAGLAAFNLLVRTGFYIFLVWWATVAVFPWVTELFHIAFQG